MELAASLAPLFSPTAAFLDLSDSSHLEDTKYHAKVPFQSISHQIIWEHSSLNPCKRVNTLQRPSPPHWRIDGCASHGTRFFAVPIGMSPGLAPKRIDVFIPDQSKHPPSLRETLQSSAAYYIKGHRINSLGISSFILQVLDYWERTTNNFRTIFEAMPFGSHIVIENVTFNLRDVRVRFVPNFEIETQLLSICTLQDKWDLPDASLPSVVDIKSLEHRFQPHQTVSLVQIPSLYATRMFACKLATHKARYLYHELQLLLKIPPHPNIISRPRHLVVGNVPSTGHIKLYGFILDYHPRGNLADVLDARAASRTLDLRDQIRWARQITSTLQVIQAGSAQFYSELKPNNLMLSDNGLDIKFIDFEQFGNWETFSAPEIHLVENVAKLVTHTVVRESKADYYRNMLKYHLREDQAHYPAWHSLNSYQREAATVYSLGKIMWCIFEGCSHTTNCMLEEFERESEVEFPAFLKTPEWMRKIITECTRGSTDWNAGLVGIVRRGCRFYSRASNALEDEPVQAAVEALEATKAMWLQRVRHMEIFLEAKARWQAGIATAEDVRFLGFPLRPSLNDVLVAITAKETSEREDLSAFDIGKIFSHGK